MTSKKNNAKNEVTSAVEDIGPAKARLYLSKNAANRPINQTMVHVHATAMLDGEWHLNGEPIIISETGRLLDGQHRLTAIIESDVEVQLVVVKGVAEAAFSTIDTGKVRSLGDVLAIEGETNCLNLAAAIGNVHRALNGKLDDRSRKAAPTNSQGLEVLESHPGIRESLRKIAGNKWPAGHSMGLYASIHYLIGMTPHAARRDEFFEAIRSGVALGKTHPAFVIRRRVENSMRQQSSMMTQLEKTAILILGWNAFASGEKVVSLVWRKTMSFPRIKGLEINLSSTPRTARERRLLRDRATNEIKDRIAKKRRA